jgi:hypothetical protein
LELSFHATYTWGILTVNLVVAGVPIVAPFAVAVAVIVDAVGTPVPLYVSVAVPGCARVVAESVVAPDVSASAS